MYFDCKAGGTWGVLGSFGHGAWCLCSLTPRRTKDECKPKPRRRKKRSKEQICISYPLCPFWPMRRLTFQTRARRRLRKKRGRRRPMAIDLNHRTRRALAACPGGHRVRYAPHPHGPTDRKDTASLESASIGRGQRAACLVQSRTTHDGPCARALAVVFAIVYVGRRRRSAGAHPPATTASTQTSLAFARLSCTHHSTPPDRSTHARIPPGTGKGRADDGGGHRTRGPLARPKNRGRPPWFASCRESWGLQPAPARVARRLGRGLAPRRPERGSRQVGAAMLQ